MAEPEPTVSLAPATLSARASRLLRQSFGYVIGGVCLIWVFHDIHIGRFLEEVRGINGWWVALAVVFDIASYVIQGLRWRFLLRPAGRISLLHAVQAIYAGLFTNEVFPMRFGELVRAYLASRWASTRFVAVIPSMAVERLFDGVWLALGIGLAAMFVPLPRNLLEAGDVLGAIVLVGTAVFLYAAFRTQRAPHQAKAPQSAGWKPWRAVKSAVEHMAGGLHALGRSRFFYAAFGLSLVLLLCQSLAFWLVMRAYGLRFSFWVGLAVLLILHLGTAIPNAPGNVGAFQFFVVVGLALFGVEKTRAAGFSVVVFLILTIPLWAIGFLALSRSGTSLSAIRHDLRQRTASENPSR
jgi:uncharacterized protein (TIRG00374 family)